MLTAEEEHDLDAAQRSAELSAMIYHQLIQQHYLDPTHLPMANRLGKLALILTFAKETQTLLYDKSKTLIEQGAEFLVDYLVGKLPASVSITIKSIELFGHYPAPVFIKNVNAAVIEVARTEQDILDHLTDAQKIAWQAEFTLSEDMAEAVAWVKGCKYLAEKIGEAKKWLGKGAQKSVDYVSSTAQQAEKAAHDRDLADEFCEASAIFELANAVSEKIKKKDPDGKVDQLVTEHCSLEKEPTVVGASVSAAGALFKQRKEPELDPKFSLAIAGGTSSGIAIVGKITMNLLPVSVGIGAAVLAIGLTVGHVYQKIKKKKFKDCQKLQEQNINDANLTCQSHARLIEKYKAAYELEDAIEFKSALEQVEGDIKAIQEQIKVYHAELERRNKQIQTELNRKDYIATDGPRQIYDELKDLYNQISRSLQAILAEIENNLIVLDAATKKLGAMK